MLNPCHRPAVRMLLCAFAAVSCYAQTITGTIVGSVADPSGAALTGAEVSAVQKATGAKRTVHSNEQGDFLMGSLRATVLRRRRERALSSRRPKRCRWAGSPWRSERFPNRCR